MEQRIIKGYLIPIYLLLSLIVVVILTRGAEGSRDYSLDAWSDDVQISYDGDDDQNYKSHLTVAELSDGSFNVAYMYYSYLSSLTLNDVSCDKLGGSLTNNTHFDLDDYSLLPYSNHYPNSYIHYDETSDRMQFIAQASTRRLAFYEISTNSNALVFDETAHIKDLFSINTTRYTIQRFYVKWDGLGRAHIAGTLHKDMADPYHKEVIFYMRVNWHPFSIQSKIVWTNYKTDINQNSPRLALTSSYLPVITYSETVGTTHFRTIGLMDAAGNWTFYRLSEWGNEQFKDFAFNGIHIDENDSIHLAWVETNPGVIRYMRLHANGSKAAGPIDVTSHYPAWATEWIKIEILLTSDGNLLFTFNPSPMSSCHIYHTVNTPLIDLVIVPDGVFDRRTIKTVRLVDIPTTSDFITHLDDDDNLFLFWLDSRTGITQVYMKHLARPGMTFRFDPMVWASASYIRPGETKVVPMELVNVGTVGFDASIFSETNASPDWDVRLDRYRSRLAPSTSVPVNLTISCPAEATEGESITVWVNATAFAGEYTANLRLVVYVKWDRVLDVFCSKMNHLVDPGGTVTFQVSLQNNGELAEDVMVSFHDIGPSGWTYTPADAIFSLAPDEAAHLKIEVTAPGNAIENEVHSLVLDFKWADWSPAHPGMVLRSVVRPTFFVTMELNRTGATVRPGDQAMFNVTVGNLGNQEGTAFVEVSIITNPGDWTVVLSAETVVLRSGEQRVIQLIVDAPEDVLGGDILIVRLRAYCPTPFSEVERDARIVVKEVHNLDWTTGPITLDLSPGGEGSRALRIGNNGNLYETISFRLEGEGDGWTWWIEQDGSGIDAIRLGPDEGTSLRIWLSAPSDALAGLVRMRLYIELEEFTLGHIDLEATMSRVPELELRILSPQVVVYPGGYYEATFEVYNRGNGPEIVDLSVNSEILESGIFVVDGVNATSVWIQAISSRTVVIRGLTLEDSPLGEGDISVTATTRQVPAVQVTGPMSIQFVRPELTITAIETIPNSPGINDVITIQVIIHNGGPLEVIDVRASLEGGEQERIASIAPDGEATAVFTWVLSKPGFTVLSGYIRYGPGNHTMPWTHKVVVGTEEEDASSQSFILIFLVGAAIILSVITMYSLRSGHIRHTP
jgi:uncharacterized repeat protein (TIGR01451 family)